MSLKFTRQRAGQYIGHTWGDNERAWRITRIGGPKGKYWQVWKRERHDGDWCPRRWVDQPRPTSLVQAILIAEADCRASYAYGDVTPDPTTRKEPA